MPVSCAVRAVERSDPLSVITTIHRSTSNITPDFRAGQQREYKAAVERFAGSQGKAHGQSIAIERRREACSSGQCGHPSVFSIGGDSGP